MIIYWAGQFRAPVSVDDMRNRSIIDCEYCQEVETAAAECRGTESFLDQVYLYIAVATNLRDIGQLFAIRPQDVVTSHEAVAIISTHCSRYTEVCSLR